MIPEQKEVFFPFCFLNLNEEIWFGERKAMMSCSMVEGGPKGRTKLEAVQKARRWGEAEMDTVKGTEAPKNDSHLEQVK